MDKNGDLMKCIAGYRCLMFNFLGHMILNVISTRIMAK
jgi:hypothetical protein